MNIALQYSFTKHTNYLLLSTIINKNAKKKLIIIDINTLYTKCHSYIDKFTY